MSLVPSFSCFCSSVCFTVSKPATKCNFACLPITISAEDNMAPLCSVKWPMCHHLIFAATAIATIITAIIVRKKQHRLCQNNQQLPTNSTFVFARCQRLQSSLLIWNLLDFFPHYSRRHLSCESRMSLSAAEAAERMLRMPTSRTSHPHKLFPWTKHAEKGESPSSAAAVWKEQVVPSVWRTWAGKSWGCHCYFQLSVLAVFFIGKPYCDWRMPAWWQESTQMKCPWERHWIPSSFRQQECCSATEAVPWLPFGTQGKENFSTRCYRVNKTTKTMETWKKSMKWTA